MSDKLQNTDSSGSLKKSTGNKLTIASGLAAGLAAGLASIELPRMFNQLVVFLLDGSGSMTYPGTSGFSKGQEVHEAVVKVLERLKESKNKASFDLTFWAFANENVEMFPIKPLKEYNLLNDCFNPSKFISDYTNTKLSALLIQVDDLIAEYLKKYDGQNRKALVIILGDGAVIDNEKAVKIKMKMDSNPLISFSSILFESSEWQADFDLNKINKLKNSFSKLASTEADYMSTIDPDKIRSHMINSVTKVSKI